MAAGVRIASGGREELTFRVALQIWRAWLSLLFGTSASLVDRNLFGPSSISFRPKSLSFLRGPCWVGQSFDAQGRGDRGIEEPACEIEELGIDGDRRKGWLARNESEPMSALRACQ
jgi:hypothetical protein